MKRAGEQQEELAFYHVNVYYNNRSLLFIFILNVLHIISYLKLTLFEFVKLIKVLIFIDIMINLLFSNFKC